MTEFFAWDDRFNLGLPAMDDEHVEIVKHMNQLHELHEGRVSGARLANAMADLVRVTRRHFADEEAYMAKVGYPGLPKHRHIHVHLLDRLGEFEAGLRKNGVAPVELFSFLKMWLKAHICGIDTQYAKFGRGA